MTAEEKTDEVRRANRVWIEMGSGMEDEKIIELYWERNQTAICETEQKYGRYCGRIAHNILHDAGDAEECLNDTWLRAWNAMPTERPGILSAFLGAITRNLSLDCYRRKHSAKRGGGVMPYIYDELRDCAGGEEPFHHVARGELAAAVNRFLADMEKESRVIFVRRYWYMDGIGEIAERLAVSESKVKSSLFRSRKRLYDYLKKEGLL